MSILTRDTEMQFPDLTIITASAGSGKTYTLARRYVQFLLSEKIAGNGVRNILAVTFTNLAAKEMKERILTLLKQAALNDKKLLLELASLVSLPEEKISLRSAQFVDEIFHSYSDFNVRTIDSFMSMVFKTSSLEFGYQPDVDISFEPESLIRQTFEEFSRDLKEGSNEARFIDELISLIEENERGSASYLWNPFSKIIREVRELHDLFGRYVMEPAAQEFGRRKRDAAKEISELAMRIRKEFDETGLPLNSYFSSDINKLLSGEILSVASKKEWENYIVKSKLSKQQSAFYEGIKKKIFKPVNELNSLLKEYVKIYAQGYYEPFIRAVRLIDDRLGQMKRLEGTVMLDDINRTLANFLAETDIPQVYIKLGETINHYLIDEFQDTSPIQWYNLHPLIENALSVSGSLFVVGDTKQSIYGFRGADWRIMKQLETNPHYFPSASYHLLELETNWRSSQAIVDFVKEVFVSKTKEIDYGEFAADSGLLQCAQNVTAEQKGKGYVETTFIQLSDDEESVLEEQCSSIISFLKDCHARGYGYEEIAILTPANADVVQISSWLNEAGIPFISHSTLDVRRRKIIGELIAFLRFLDSPVDNLSFATFVLGDVFQKVLSRDNFPARTERLREILHESAEYFFYRSFQNNFPDAWGKYFDALFSRVGYMPLYDLVSEVYKTLSVFELCKDEEGALVKFLECVKRFENERNNSIKDFLSFSREEGEGDEWSIDVPANVQAVRVMTVHKSKGLGFPVVVALFKDRSRKVFGPVIEETENGLTMLKVTKGLAERNEELTKFYQQQEKERNIDELNRLYVALTRAQREMYVVSLAAKEKKTKSKEEEEIKIPSMLFPEKQFGKKFTLEERKHLQRIETSVRVSRIDASYLTVSARMPVAEYEKIGLAETMRGDFVHDVLSQIEFLGEDTDEMINKHLDAAQQKYAVNYSTVEMKKTLKEFLSLKEVRQYFERSEKRKILREQDFVTQTGQLFRMDRVIVDETSIAVVDFKTGNDTLNDKYKEQVRNYISILSTIYAGKKISGALLYVDMRKVVPVE